MYSGGRDVVVPTVISAGLGSTLPIVGMPAPLWWAVCALTVLVGAYACLMACGALWRCVPAGWRRRLASQPATCCDPTCSDCYEETTP